MVETMGRDKLLAAIYWGKFLTDLRDIDHTWLSFHRVGSCIEVRQTEKDSLSWIGTVIDIITIDKEDAKSFRAAVVEYLKPRIEATTNRIWNRNGTLYGAIWTRIDRNPNMGSVVVYRHELDNSLAVVRGNFNDAWEGYERIVGFRTIKQAIAEAECYAD